LEQIAPSPQGRAGYNRAGRSEVFHSRNFIVAKMTLIIGGLLCVLGVVTYAGAFQFGADKRSVTALIPAFLGFALVLLAYAALLKPAMRMHLMHAAVMLTLLGLLASLGRIGMVAARSPKVAQSPLNPATAPVGVAPAAVEPHSFWSVGVIANLIMAALCLTHVILSVRSFIAARRAREAGAPVVV
jgi:hypothetical protein